MKVNAIVGKPGVERQRQEGTQEKWHHDADVAGQDRSVPMTFQFFVVKRYPHHEHVNHDADLAESVQVHEAGWRKEKHRDVGRSPAQQRRPEQNASHHLTNYLRLIDEPEKEAEYAGGGDDHDNLQDQRERCGH